MLINVRMIVNWRRACVRSTLPDAIVIMWVLTLVMIVVMSLFVKTQIDDVDWVVVQKDFYIENWSA